ncbi:MAG: hypothetical protein Q4B27_01705 [Candidatus Saccharibacteria bacterium]|nr:hypothetical protein [Candidatus Saccharibacteria bacterium]
MNRERTATGYEQNVDDWYRPMPKQEIAIRVENAAEVSCIVDTCEELLAQSTPVSRLDAAIKEYDVAISRNDGEAIGMLSHC